MVRKTKIINSTFVGAACLALAFLTLFFSGFGATSALEPAESDVNVYVSESVSVAVSNDHVRFEIVPTAGGAFNSSSTTVRVDTNAPGYTLYMQDADSNTDLKHIDGVVSTKFETLSEAATVSLIPVNKWGYSLDSQTYNGIPTTLTTLKSLDEPLENGTDSTKIDFGAKADTSLVSGIYQDTVVLTVSPKVISIEPTIFDVTYMQDMTPTLCKNTATPKSSVTQIETNYNKIKYSLDDDGDATYVPQKTLIDRRDGKEYLVRKLADGNCWMAQNLEFDILGEGDTYYTGTSSNAAANDADVAVTASNYFGGMVKDNREDETFRLTDQDTDLHTTTVWTPKYFKTTYADSGKAPNAKVYRTITGTRTTTNAAYGWANNGNDGMRSYNYANSKADWAYSIPTGAFDGNGNMTFDSAASGEPYQRYGNLYNWTAATLGSGLGLSTDGQQAKDSICPRGWQLPDNEGNKSFRHLLTDAYGLTANGASVSDFNALNSAPLHFLRTGYYYRTYGFIGEYTVRARWWSGTSGVDTIGVGMDTLPSHIYAQGGSLRGFGFAVRCVAR